MEHTQVQYQGSNELRRRAERLLEQGVADIGKMSADEIARLVEELHASQGELLRQNVELSRIQAELEESRDKLSDLYDFVPVGYFTFDQDYLITDANHTAADLLGVDRDALAARAFTDFVAPGFKDIFVHHCTRSIEKRTIQTCPLKLVKDDGCEFYAQLDSLALQDDKSGRRRIRISVTDVTERRRVIAEVMRLAAIVESSDDAIIGKDLDNRITSWNRAAERIYGYSADEMRGKSISILLPPDDPDGVATLLENLKRGERVDHFETVHTTRDGRRIHVSLTISPIQDTEGNIAGASTIARDITERKMAERVMLEYQKRLRTQASQLSLTEERERRRIATDLHDNVIQGLALSMIKLGLLRESSEGIDEALFSEVSETLDRAIEDMRNMTFDISSPTLYKLGLSAAVDELLDDMVCRQHSIDYEFYDDQQKKPLDDDVLVLLFQSVRELLINVIKHAEAQKVTVNIERVGESVCTIVSDDGVGFDVDHTDLTMHRMGGFGLFNIRERLDYIGGSMEIKSLPGQGSTFVLIAPLQKYTL